MSTAIIGAGNIGRTVAGHVVDGGESVVLAEAVSDFLGFRCD